MADILFNIAKGRHTYYATLPATNDALIAVPIEATGIETDSVMQDYDTLAGLLAPVAVNEQTTMGRKTLASVTSTVDDTNDRVDVDATDISWIAATGNAISAVVVCYDPDTTGGTDADLIPLYKYDFGIFPDGSDVELRFNASGLARAV